MVAFHPARTKTINDPHNARIGIAFCIVMGLFSAADLLDAKTGLELFLLTFAVIGYTVGVVGNSYLLFLSNAVPRPEPKPRVPWSLVPEEV